jgi:hypothetical protein
MPDSLPVPVYKWPSTEIDNRAFDLAVAELGVDVPISAILLRAQSIKEEFQRQGAIPA